MPLLRFGETVEARAYSPEDPPTTYTNDTTVERTGTPTEAWLRRQAIASIKRQPPQEKQEEKFPEDQDYGCDYQNHTNLLSQPTIPIKELSVATQKDRNENAPDDHPSLQTPEEDTHGSTKLPIFHDEFPNSLNSIKK